MVVIADGYAQLLAHVLAHVPLDRAGNLHDPRYVAWSRAHLDASSQAMLEHDTALIGARWRADARLDVLHESFSLHRDLEGFRRTAARPLAQLHEHEIADAELLRRLLAPAIAPVAELLHACLALLDDVLAPVLAACAPELERACVDIDACLARLHAGVPELANARVELLWPLGLHGRALDAFDHPGGGIMMDSAASPRVLVGAPAAWNGLAPARQAVLAAHERLVAASGEREYLAQEWAALTGLARRMAVLDDVALRAAHAAWLAELDLQGLLSGVLARGWLSPSTCARILERLDERASLLATRDLHPGPGHLQG